MERTESIVDISPRSGNVTKHSRCHYGKGWFAEDSEKV